MNVSPRNRYTYLLDLLGLLLLGLLVVVNLLNLVLLLGLLNLLVVLDLLQEFNPKKKTKREQKGKSGQTVVVAKDDQDR